MKHLLFFSLLFCFGCKPEPEETPPPYPATYVFEKIESKPSKFYVLGQGTAYTEIPAKGSFVDYDEAFAAELDAIKDEIHYFDSIALLDASRARLHVNPAYNPQAGSIEVNYAQNGNYFRLQVANATAPLVFQLDAPTQTFRWGLVNTSYSYLNNFSKKTDYSPFDLNPGAFETTVKVDSLLNSIRAKSGVRVGDTVAVAFPVGIYLAK